MSDRKTGEQVNQRIYSGNARPFIYAQFALQDRERAKEVLSAFRERGYDVWPSEKSDKRRLEKAALVILFLSPAAAADEAIDRTVNYAAGRTTWCSCDSTHPTSGVTTQTRNTYLSYITAARA
jgi:hypothetical protein